MSSYDESEDSPVTEETSDESEESSAPAPKRGAKKAPIKKKGSDEDSDEDSDEEADTKAKPVRANPNAVYGGSAVIQRIMARKAKWQFLGKRKDDGSGESDEDDKKGKGKKGKASKKGGKASKKGDKKSKKDDASIEVRRLEPTDMGYHEMASHFMEHHPKTTEVETILDVFNEKTWNAFEKYRDKVAKKRPYLVRNDLLVQRVYHGTFLRCDLGMKDNTTPCKHPDCRVCQIIRKGFKLSNFGTGARKPEDAKGLDGFGRFGKGHYFSDWASKAQEFSTAFATQAGKRGRTAVLACQVVVGKSQPLWDYNGSMTAPEKGYDSVKGEVANVDHPLARLKSPETVVYSDDAAVVTQVIVYSHSSPMCPNCGQQVDWDGPTARVRDDFGFFCSELCNTSFKTEVEDFEKKARDTPTDLDDNGMMPFWEMTNSEENCDLVPLWPSSIEGTIISNKLKKSMPNVTIHKMFRVQNRALHERYVEELNSVIDGNGGKANEQLLWHGTRDKAPDAVLEDEEGLSKAGGMWGKGIYFAVNASYSDDFAFVEGNGYRSMFLSKVCLGEMADLASDSLLKEPPEKDEGKKKKKGKASKKRRYDSVTGVTNGARVHIVYDSAKCYPAYLVTYSPSTGGGLGGFTLGGTSNYTFGYTFGMS